MATLRIRTITYFACIETGKEQEIISKAAEFCSFAQKRIEDAKIEVQGCRIGADGFLDFRTPQEGLLARVKNLDNLLEKHNLVLNHGPTSDPTALQLIPDLLRSTKNIYFNFALPNQCDWSLLLQSAQTILSISRNPGVTGSFRFCVSAQCPPYIPYFPASFASAESSSCFAIGLESSGLLDGLPDCQWDLNTLEKELRHILMTHLTPIQDICLEIEKITNCTFCHFDSSLCPRLEKPPMTNFWNRFGIDVFGQPGTLSVCSALTNAIKSLTVQSGGFCGLMLPICEDAGLVEAANQKSIRIGDLLYYSTVCACGLDCVPVSGYADNCSENERTEFKIAAYLMDLHSIAIKLKKPLSCRFLPVTNGKPGDFTDFKFPHLINAKIMEF